MYRLVRTISGAEYQVTVRQTADGGLVLWARKQDEPTGRPVIAVFPDRVPYVEATASVRALPNGKVEGLNKDGVRTVLFDPTTILRGMVLVDRRGFRSTAVVAVTAVG